MLATTEIEVHDLTAVKIIARIFRKVKGFFKKMCIFQNYHSEASKKWVFFKNFANILYEKIFICDGFEITIRDFLIVLFLNVRSRKLFKEGYT